MPNAYNLCGRSRFCFISSVKVRLSMEIIEAVKSSKLPPAIRPISYSDKDSEFKFTNWCRIPPLTGLSKAKKEAWEALRGVISSFLGIWGTKEMIITPSWSEFSQRHHQFSTKLWSSLWRAWRKILSRHIKITSWRQFNDEWTPLRYLEAMHLSITTTWNST